MSTKYFFMEIHCYMCLHVHFPILCIIHTPATSRIKYTHCIFLYLFARFPTFYLSASPSSAQVLQSHIHSHTFPFHTRLTLNGYI